MNKEELTLKIETLKSHTMGLNERIEIKAIWLFVATLSCWSVNYSFLQLIAMVFVVILYIKQIKNKANMSFLNKKAEISDIENAIEQIERDSDERKARQYDLDVIKKCNISIVNTPVFHCCYLFWAFSLLVFIFRAWNDYFSLGFGMITFLKFILNINV